MTDQNCIFCKISSNEIPVPKLLENADVTAFFDAEPLAETHILIVPKAHLPNFLSVDNSAVWDAMRQAAQELIRQQALEGAYKLVFNGGSYQHIPHLHWHLLGGKLSAHP